MLVEPDAKFIKDVIASGGEDLKKCYQCATCSVVCVHSPDDAPFPRPQMIAAQWGLKQRVLSDPALWLCHNCGECTDKCPRGARPGDVLNALRREAIKYLAFPRFLGRAVNNPAGLLPLLLLPVLVFAAIALWAPKHPSARLEFGNVFPIAVLEPLFFALAAWVLVAFAVGLKRLGFRPAGLLPALALIATHKRFFECAREKNRSTGHLLTMWGFAGLAVVGTITGIATMAGLLHTPLALANPLKIFANVCAVIILAGVAVLLVERVRTRNGTYYDWFFLLALAGVAFTGVASELLRLAGAAQIMYAVYFVHLVLIFALFLYAPYSKFAHFLYRTVAIAATYKFEERTYAR